MNLKNKWIEHLKENNMTYLQHLIFATGYGFTAMFAGLLLVIHAFLPCFFQNIGSELVSELSKKFKNRKSIDDT